MSLLKNLLASCPPGMFRRGGELFFDREAALAFVASCDDSDVAISGIEAFRITASTTEPLSRYMADFTNPEPGENWAQFRVGTVTAARGFLRELPGELFVAFGVIDAKGFERHVRHRA